MSFSSNISNRSHGSSSSSASFHSARSHRSSSLSIPTPSPRQSVQMPESFDTRSTEQQTGSKKNKGVLHRMLVALGIRKASTSSSSTPSSSQQPVLDTSSSEQLTEAQTLIALIQQKQDLKAKFEQKLSKLEDSKSGKSAAKRVDIANKMTRLQADISGFDNEIRALQAQLDTLQPRSASSVPVAPATSSEEDTSWMDDGGAAAPTPPPELAHLRLGVSEFITLEDLGFEYWHRTGTEWREMAEHYRLRAEHYERVSEVIRRRLTTETPPRLTARALTSRLERALQDAEKARRKMEAALYHAEVWDYLYLPKSSDTRL